MNSALEVILVAILKDLGGQAHVAEVRNRMREQGRHPPAEETLLRLGRQSPRIREAGPGVSRCCPTSARNSPHPRAFLKMPNRRPVSHSAISLPSGAAVTSASISRRPGPIPHPMRSSRSVQSRSRPRPRDQHLLRNRFTRAIAHSRLLCVGSLKIEPDGVMDRLIRAAEPWERTAPRFYEFVGDLPLVAQNACQLDLPFLRLRGLDPSHPVVDTLELSWLVLSHLERHSLEYLAELTGYPEGCSEVAASLALQGSGITTRSTTRPSCTWSS